MADPKDGESFFRKVVRFVANPATDWSEVATRPDDSQDIERSELKAMVERKRRNDFVRKREFDTLRKLRRDGLSPEQLAALGGSSKVDDSEVRLTENSIAARSDVGVKAKIDEIEQQMVGDGQRRDAAPRRPVASTPRPVPASAAYPSDFYSAPTEPVAFDPGRAAPTSSPVQRAAPAHPALDHLPPLPDLDFTLPAAPVTMATGIAPLSPAQGGQGGGHTPGHTPGRSPGHTPGHTPDRRPAGAGAAASPGQPRPRDTGMAGRDPPPPPPGGGLPQVDLSFETNSRFAVEVNELVHDPELDEAVIAFANADFNHCEQALTALCKPGAARHRHADTWHVLLDLYRATGQQVKFDALSLDYAHLFGRSSPQWYSLPKRVADAAADDRPDTRGVKGDVGWISPALLDVDAVARLRSSTLQLPLPWVLDWSAIRRVDVEAAAQLQRLFRQWAPQAIDMRWMAAERLLAALQEAAPTGVRDADPAFWMARLEALRLANRPDQFDETAIDYCVTYEVSPPSWERARCQVRSSNANNSTTTPPLSIVGEVSSSFMESGLQDDSHTGVAITTVDLSGQLAGDIGPTLQQIDRKLGAANLVQVSCARLIRVDFIAAGDLLNWVLAKRTENRSVTFVDAHRLVALFFGAMGINEHARVQIPRD
jgi:ABC-type transporter Mla MlaB component